MSNFGRNPSFVEQKKTIKIVFIITGLSAGGAEIMLLRLLERLDARFSKHVISLTNIGEIGTKIRSLGIAVEALGMKPGLLIPLDFVRLIQIIRMLKPDIVHTWMYHSDLIGGLAARAAGVSAIAWSLRHSNLSPDLNKQSTLLVMRACARLSSWLPRRILSCSEKARTIHIAAGYAANKITVIPNGFDLSSFRPDPIARNLIRTGFNLPLTTPLVGLIARYDPQKNHIGFISAAAHIHRSRPDVHYLLAGKGINRENKELMDMINHAGLSSCIHLLGHREDIPRLMAALDVLASASNGEAFPNVLGEAMACGIPCAVTNAGDSSYIVGDTGRITRIDDMIELGDAIKALLDLPPNERKLLGINARARVSNNFEINRVVKLYEVFYDDLVALP
ncbi:MAG: glycosyltransferase family 4 protein [Steroidobacteraceae bacterium]